MILDFACRLKNLRNAKGYSQVTLARKITDSGLKLSEATLAKYESGRTYPNLQTAAYLADYFGVSIDYLACGEKASVVNIEGLTEEQVALIVDVIQEIKKKNASWKINSKAIPSHEQQAVIFRLIEQFIK